MSSQSGAQAARFYSPAVLLRRILWLVAALLAVAVVVAAIIPIGDDDKPATTTTATAPERTTVKVAIGASPAKVRTIPARIGDHLQLTVESDRIDTVTIDGVDDAQPVDPTSPARFDTLLSRAGRFPIRMQENGNTVGVLQVDRS